MLPDPDPVEQFGRVAHEPIREGDPLPIGHLGPGGAGRRPAVWQRETVGDGLAGPVLEVDEPGPFPRGLGHDEPPGLIDLRDEISVLVERIRATPRAGGAIVGSTVAQAERGCASDTGVHRSSRKVPASPSPV